MPVCIDAGTPAAVASVLKVCVNHNDCLSQVACKPTERTPSWCCAPRRHLFFGAGTGAERHSWHPEARVPCVPMGTHCTAGHVACFLLSTQYVKRRIRLLTRRCF